MSERMPVAKSSVRCAAERLLSRLHRGVPLNRLADRQDIEWVCVEMLKCLDPK